VNEYIIRFEVHKRNPANCIPNAVDDNIGISIKAHPSIMRVHVSVPYPLPTVSLCCSVYCGGILKHKPN